MNNVPASETPLFQIIYESKATRSFSEAEVEALLAASRTSNSRKGITGILLYRNGTFTQVLEGEESAIRALLEKIQRDPRHQNLSVRLEQTIVSRSFPNWSMAYSRRDLSEFMHR
ncbi:MAG: hypothetical protein RLZ25_2213 [Pseudomonadota bacterium]|jgi:hypothetical protein